MAVLGAEPSESERRQPLAHSRQVRRFRGSARSFRIQQTTSSRIADEERQPNIGLAASCPHLPPQAENDKAGEPNFRQIIDSSPALIHTARADGYLDFFNRTWLDFPGQPLESLLGWKWTSYIHPADVQAFVQTWRRAVPTC